MDIHDKPLDTQKVNSTNFKMILNTNHSFQIKSTFVIGKNAFQPFSTQKQMNYVISIWPQDLS